MIQGILLGMLGLCAVEDVWKKKINVWCLCLFSVAGVAIHLWRGSLSPLNLLSGAAVGLGVLLLGIVLGGSVGAGDGVLLTATGIFLGGSRNLELLFVSLLLAALFALGMMVFRKWKRSHEIPFAPFVFFGYAIMVLEEVL